MPSINLPSERDLFQLPQLREGGGGAFVPDGAVLGSAAAKRGEREGIDVIALGRVVAMGDGVGFDRAGPCGVGRPAARRHRVPQERPWACWRTAPFGDAARGLIAGGGRSARD